MSKTNTNNNSNNNYVCNYIGTHLHKFEFAATSSKQQPRTAQQIYLYCSRFLLQISCPNSSNLTIIILTKIQNIYICFISFKKNVDRETYSQNCHATALKLLLYKPIFSACSYYFLFLNQ